MSQPPDLERLPKEERIELALELIKGPQQLSVRRATACYNVSETTLRRRRVGKKSLRDTHPKSSNLKETEGEALAQYINKLDA